MENYSAVNALWFWALMIIILALHITCVFLRKKRAALTAVSAVNIALHIGLIIAMLIARAEPQELFFAMLLSVSVALVTTRRKEDR